MTNPKENIKNENQPASQPAGEASGSDLPPQGQGGPHLPDISEPTSKSLSKQFESGPPLPADPPTREPVEEPHGTYKVKLPGPYSERQPTVDPPHKCFVCGSPNHHACGCEAKELQRQIEQDDKAFRSQDIVDEEQAESRMGQEMRDEGIDPELVRSFDEYADRLDERMKSVLDGLSDVNSNLETLVKLQQERRDLLKDIENGRRN